MPAKAEAAPAWETGPGNGGLAPSQLLWLLLAVAVALVPHQRAVPAWVTAAIAGAAAWRYAALVRGVALPGTVARGLLALLGVVAVSFVFRSISGIDAGSALLILMLALKILETTGPRDRGVVVQIAWFLLFAGFLREQSLASVAELGLGLGAGTLALLCSTRTAPPLPPDATLRTGARLLALALPLAIALFLLFPRLPGAFWSLPGAGSGRTGLADHMSPGDITSLARSDEVAFRVRFLSGRPEPPDLYWRGPVLERFDGRRWRTRTNDAEALQSLPAPADTARPVAYELTLEPHDQRWLLALDVPVRWSARDAALTGDAQLLGPRPVQVRMAYRAESRLAASYSAAAPPSLDLAVPAGNPRTRELAAELRLRAGSDAAYLDSILRFFHDREFSYTLSPPALGPVPVDDFLFRTRAGFCEHYASAFAVLARLAGIPARVVTGYQGAEFNPVGSYWIVRQSDAHAWAEAWLDGRWVRYDPTAAVAPARIEAGLDAALPETAGGGLPILGTSPFLTRIALGWDATNAAWDRWVLAFGPERQAELMRDLGFRSPTLRDLALVCAGAVAIAALVFVGLGLRRSGAGADPLEDAWRALLRRLGGITRPRRPDEGPAEYVAAVSRARPDLAGPLGQLLRTYLELRYERTPLAGEVAAFRRRARGLAVRPEPARG